MPAMDGTIDSGKKNERILPAGGDGGIFHLKNQCMNVKSFKTQDTTNDVNGKEKAFRNRFYIHKSTRYRAYNRYRFHSI